MTRRVMSAGMGRVLLALWYGGLLVGGIAVLWVATPWGIGIRHDSLSYLTAAENMAHGGCLCRIGSGLEAKPLVHFGPLYPTLLWALTLVSGDVLVAGRWITAVLYGVNLAAWGALVHVHTRRWWAGAIVSTVLAVSPVLLRVHDAAMSEPLFLAIMALALLAMAAYLTTGNRRDLWLAAGAVAAAILTRYAAGVLLGLGAVAVVVLHRASWRDRLLDGLRFSAASAIPVGLWLTRNLLLADTATNRTLRWHPITLHDLRSLLRTVTSWFSPRQFSHWIEGGLLLGFLLVVAIWLWKGRTTRSGEDLAPVMLGLILVGFVVAYPAYIAVSRSLFDDTIPIDDRMLSPMYVALVALVGVLAGLAGRYRRGVWILLAAAAIALAGPLPYMVGGFQAKFESMRQDGVLFASRAWQESESISWMRRLPADSIVYSNQAVPLQLFTGRPAYQLPEGYDAVKAEPRADFLAQLDRMHSDLQRPGSYLLIFNPDKAVSPADLEDEYTIGLSVVQVLADGFIMASGSWGETR